MISIPVVVKSLGEEVSQKKNITMPNNATFLCLRLQISEDFNLKNSDFDFLLGSNGSIKLSQENEEEYALQVIGNYYYFIVRFKIILRCCIRLYIEIIYYFVFFIKVLK